MSNNPQQSSAHKKNSREILNLTEISEAPATEHIILSSLASPEPQLITIQSDSNEPTIPYGYPRQDPKDPPSLNDLNLPAIPLNILANIEVVHPTAATYDANYNPQSPEPLEPSSISTVVKQCVRLLTTALLIQTGSQGGSTSYHKVLLLLRHSASWKEKSAQYCPFQNEGAFQHACNACGQTPPSRKDIPGPSTDWSRLYNH